MWITIHYSMQGRSHIKENIPCQDKTFAAFANDTYVIALADGAGSARLSHFGAETITRQICSHMIDNFDNYFANDDGIAVKHQIFNYILGVLDTEAKQLECEINDLASTLLCVAIKETSFILLHIGDGVIGYLKNNDLLTASQPENGEYVNTTVFTTSPNAIMTARLIKGTLNAISGFVLMSDGSEAGLYDKKDQMLSNGLHRIMELSKIVRTDIIKEQLAQSFQNVIKNTTQDDCSIAILVRPDDDFSGYSHLSNKRKCEILGINPNSPKRIIRRYDSILTYLLNGRNTFQIARQIHLKKKYTIKYLQALQARNLIEQHGNRFTTIIIMDT